MNKSAIELVKSAEQEAYRGVYSVHGYNLTTSPSDNIFINTAQNAFAEKALLAWSHLFGSKTEQFHKNFQLDIRQVFADPTIKAIDPRFKKMNIYGRIVAASGLDEEQYEEYWGNMKTVRDNFIAHKDLSSDPNMPDLEIALEMFKALRNEMWELSKAAFAQDSENKELEKLCNYYEWNANHMLENEVVKAFKASGIVIP